VPPRCDKHCGSFGSAMLHRVVGTCDPRAGPGGSGRLHGNEGKSVRKSNESNKNAARWRHTAALGDSRENFKREKPCRQVRSFTVALTRASMFAQ
jgi:hypothetical protein